MAGGQQNWLLKDIPRGLRGAQPRQIRRWQMYLISRLHNKFKESCWPWFRLYYGSPGRLNAGHGHGHFTSMAAYWNPNGSWTEMCTVLLSTRGNSQGTHITNFVLVTLNVFFSSTISDKILLKNLPAGQRKSQDAIGINEISCADAVEAEKFLMLLPRLLAYTNIGTMRSKVLA